MQSNKCHDCGLVNFSAAENCQRCDAPLAARPDYAAAGAHESAPARRPNATVPKAVLILGAVVLLAAAVAAPLKLRGRWPARPSRR